LKYSIIIPTLNEEKLLPLLLKQLTDKNYREQFDTEIIVSDSGSSDCTVEIALTYADKVVVNTARKNGNIAICRNKGAKIADGELLIFLNSDILIDHPIRFFYYIDNNFINSHYLAMTCDVRISPEQEIIKDKLFHFAFNNYFRLLNNYVTGMGRGECQVIRKETFHKLNGYNENLAAGEDFDFFRRIKKIGDILYSNIICVYESPRRYRKFGYTDVTWQWLRNSHSIIFNNRSFSKEWEEVR